MEQSEQITEAIDFGKKKLCLDTLKEKQIQAIAAFLRGEDVFVNLPTGYGKSVIFQIAPFCHEYKTNFQNKSVVVVVCPLIALMKDQVKFLQRNNVDAVYLADCEVDGLKQKLSEGRCLFSRPPNTPKKGTFKKHKK